MREKRMIDVAICDDDINITGKLDSFFYDYGKRKRLILETDIFDDGNSLVSEISKGKRYDIIFLDIEMEHENGIQAAQKIRTFDKNVLIIYITSYEQYMLEAFSVHPFQFILKPFKTSEIATVFDEAYKEMVEFDHYFRYKYERIERKILVKDIMYFKSNKRKVYIYATHGKYEMYGKLNNVEHLLSKGKIMFMRIHQSFLVNYTYIAAMGYDHVVLSNGTRLSISEDRKKRICEQYCNVEDGINICM